MAENAEKIAALLQGREMYEEMKQGFLAFSQDKHEAFIQVQCEGCGSGHSIRIGDDAEDGIRRQVKETGMNELLAQYIENKAAFQTFAKKMADSCDAPLAFINSEIEKLTN